MTFNKKFTPAQPNWNNNLIIVCSKCGEKIAPGENLAATFKDQLKKDLVADKKWGSTRVMVSSCLGTCPEGEITIANIDCKNTERKTEIFTVKKEDLSEFKEFIKTKI